MTEKQIAQVKLLMAQCLHEAMKEYIKGFIAAAVNETDHAYNQECATTAYKAAQERCAVMVSTAERSTLEAMVVNAAMDDFSEYYVTPVTLLLAKGLTPEALTKATETVIRKQEHAITSLV